MVYSFDTLGYAKRLRDAGVAQAQAEAHAEAARDFVMAELVTKTDLQALSAHFDAKLENTDAKLDAKLKNMDARLENMDAKLDAKLENMDARLDTLSLRLNARGGHWHSGDDHKARAIERKRAYRKAPAFGETSSQSRVIH
jgi:Skp family chaperone for outer membrane proteins